MRRKIKRNNFSSIIKTHIYNNFKEYLSISLLLIIGIVIGVITINNSNEEQVNEISTYINNFLGDLKEVSNIDTGALLINIFFNNLYLILILWFVGSTVIGIPIVYGIIGYKGFCLGYTISSSIITLGTAKGTCFSLASMLLQNIIYIPCIANVVSLVIANGWTEYRYNWPTVIISAFLIACLPCLSNKEPVFIK